jgi:hypothetical protein
MIAASIMPCAVVRRASFLIAIKTGLPLLMSNVEITFEYHEESQYLEILTLGIILTISFS